MASTARIEELRKKFEENPRRYFAPLANEYRKAGDIEQAISICQEHLPQQPGHMSGHIVYGQALFESKRLDEARSVFETALALDPENLIALRQLGDIAREIGDAPAACIWYQRVLDADPRNEEIAEVLKSLQESTTALTGDLGGTAQAGGNSGSAPTAEVANPFADLGADLAAELEQPEPAPAIETSPSAYTQSPVGHATEHASRVQASPAPRSPVEEEEFTLDFEEPSPAASQPPSADALAGASSSLPLEGFETTQRERAEGAGQGSDAAPGSELDEIDALFDADGGTETGSQPSQTPAAAFVTETMAELYLRQGHREEAIEVYRQLVAQRPDNMLLRQRLAELDRLTPASEAPPQSGVAPEPGEGAPVVPESSAAEAGTVEAASSGASPTMRELLGAIAQRRPTAPPPPANVDSTVRPEEESVAASASSPPSPGPDDSFGDFASESLAWSSRSEVTVEAVADMPPPADVSEPPPAHLSERPPERATGERQDSVSGSLDALFVGAGAVEEATGAASTLAQGYGDDAGGHETAASEPLEEKAPAAPAAEEAPLQGKPARRASDELSLDHVFKEPAAGAGSDSAFSFDQFFAESANDSGGGSGSGMGAGAGGAAGPDQPLASATPTIPSAPMPDDIEQFNAWLEGLKKS